MINAEEVGERWGTADREREHYRITDIPIPKDLVIEAGAFCDLPDGLRSCAVTFAARESALLGPAAVAIHDDGDVAGNVRKFRHGALSDQADRTDQSDWATSVCVRSGPTPTKAMGAPHSSPRRLR